MPKLRFRFLSRRHRLPHQFSHLHDVQHAQPFALYAACAANAPLYTPCMLCASCTPHHSSCQVLRFVRVLQADNSVDKGVRIIGVLIKNLLSVGTHTYTATPSMRHPEGQPSHPQSPPCSCDMLRCLHRVMDDALSYVLCHRQQEVGTILKDDRSSIGFGKIDINEICPLDAFTTLNTQWMRHAPSNS